MAAIVKFDDTSMFRGFTISYKLMGNDLSKTMILAEAYRRLEMCLESLNFEGLQNLLRNHSFYIKTSLNNINDGDVILISLVQ